LHWFCDNVTETIGNEEGLIVVVGTSVTEGVREGLTPAVSELVGERLGVDVLEVLAETVGVEGIVFEGVCVEEIVGSDDGLLVGVKVGVGVGEEQL